MLHHTSSHRLTSNLASPDTWQIKLILFDDKCEGNHPAALQQSSRIINAATNKIPPVAKRILTMAGLWHQIFMLARLVIETLSLDIDPLVGDVTAVKCHPVLALLLNAQLPGLSNRQRVETDAVIMLFKTHWSWYNSWHVPHHCKHENCWLEAFLWRRGRHKSDCGRARVSKKLSLPPPPLLSFTRPRKQCVVTPWVAPLCRVSRRLPTKCLLCGWGMSLRLQHPAVSPCPAYKSGDFMQHISK